MGEGSGDYLIQKSTFFSKKTQANKYKKGTNLWNLCTISLEHNQRFRILRQDEHNAIRK